MKNQILAYLAAVINQYERTEKIHSVCTIKIILNDLEDLTDFVADLKESETKENDEIETLNYQIYIYKNKVDELIKENIELKKLSGLQCVE